MMTLPTAVLPDWPEPRPRAASFPAEADWSAGDEAVELAASAGLFLDPWQQWSLRAGLGARPDGRWASFEVGLEVPRQDGKGAILEARELAGLFLFGEMLGVHTAHEFKTCQEAFVRLKTLIESSADLSSKVAQITTGNGDEAIKLKSGARLRFLARSGGSGRGFSGDLVVLDEAYKLPPTAMGALLPTMAARHSVTVGGPQVWYASSGGQEDSEVLAGVRDRGLTGGESLTWIEYSAGAPDDHEGRNVDLDDRDEWLRANPAMHGPHPRIPLEFVEREREVLTDDEFARERLCLWSTGSRISVIDADLWASLAVEGSKMSAPGAFAVDIPPERRSATICVAGPSADGLMQVEVVDQKPGTSWAVQRLVDLVERWKVAVVLDPASPAGSLIPDLVRAKVEPQMVTGRAMAQACGAFYDLTQAKELIHLGDPRLATAVDAGRKRHVGDAWAWHRRDTSADISPLVAATLAVYGAANPPEPKREKTGRAAFY